MRIKRIKNAKKHATIILEDNSQFKISLNLLEDYKLYINKDISPKEIKLIKSLNEEETYFEFISKKINIDDLTSGNVKHLLKNKGANETQINSVINRLKKAHLIDDKKFVDEISENYDTKHYGHNKLIQKLYEKKIDESYIKNIIVNNDDELNNALITFDKSINKFKNKNFEEQKKSMYSLLIRKGFSSELSLEVISKNIIFDKNHELNVLKLDYLKSLKRFNNKSVSDPKNKIKKYLLSKGYKLEDINTLEDFKNEMD